MSRAGRIDLFPNAVGRFSGRSAAILERFAASPFRVRVAQESELCDAEGGLSVGSENQGFSRAESGRELLMRRCAR